MKDCIFCKIIRGDIPSYKVFENENTLAFLDVQPIARYHTLIIPKEHYENFYDIPEDLNNAVFKTAKQVAKLYSDKLGIDNLQLFHNAGPLTLQSVFHFHLHLIPRTEEDKHQFSLKIRTDLADQLPLMLEKLK